MTSGRDHLRVVLASALSIAACSPCDGTPVTVGPLEICAEVAATEAARARGLMGRSGLEDDEGLLLDFPVADEICIVNEGVGFAIDAIYAAPDGRVTRVERAIPAGDPTPRCVLDTQRVLEVGADIARDVSRGDPVFVGDN